MQSNIKSRSLIMVLAVIACLILAYFFLFPNYSRLNDNKQLVAQAEVESEKLKQAESDLNNFLKDYEDLKKEREVVQMALPAKDFSLPFLLANMEELVKSSGLTVSTINIKEADQTKQVADNAVDYKDLEIQVNGSYAGFKNFLLLMESNLRIMDLQQINFQV